MSTARTRRLLRAPVAETRKPASRAELQEVGEQLVSVSAEILLEALELRVKDGDGLAVADGDEVGLEPERPLIVERASLGLPDELAPRRRSAARRATSRKSSNTRCSSNAKVTERLAPGRLLTDVPRSTRSARTSAGS